MDLRKSYFKNIQSYLLANSSDEGELEEEHILALYSNTLAFSLADDNERERLQSVFTIAASTVNAVEPRSRVVFGKALLGVDELTQIESWINEHVELLSNEYSIEQWLDILWPLVRDIVQNKKLVKLVGENADIFIAKQWINGQSYIDILKLANERGYKFTAGAQERVLNIDNILDICDGALGYDVMLIIGAIADLIENLQNLDEQADVVRSLQRSLKLGLSTSVEHWLYSKGLADRVVCSYLNDKVEWMGDEEKIGDAFFDECRGYIEPALDQFPSIFKQAVYR